jgi:hypothetical protein
MAYTYAAVRVGGGKAVHLGQSYSIGGRFVTRCAAGGLKTATTTSDPITCINCLTRYDSDLYLFRAGRTRASVEVPRSAS